MINLTFEYTRTKMIQCHRWTVNFHPFGDVVGIEEYCEHLQIPISHVPSLQSLSFVVFIYGIVGIRR